MTSNRLTVVIPAYNAESILKPCIQSIFLCGERNIKIIVVDDGSTDGTRTIAESLGAHYIYQPKSLLKNPS
jgi:glycosyltransferase involved in cell wall biosynthesis